MSRPRRGVTLLVVLVSLALLAALIVPLATLSGVSALESVQRAAALRHRLAVDSVVAILPELLARDQRLIRDLDQANRAPLSFDLEEVHVEILLQDDTAKLPIPMLREQRGAQRIQSALGILRAALPLVPLGLASSLSQASTLGVEDKWPWSGCPEDLFSAPTDAALYGTPTTTTASLQYLTPLGQAVHAFRASPAVLEALLADLQPGLGLQLAQNRQRQVRPDLDGLFEGIELSEPVRRAARQRLTHQTQRYSLLVRTRLGDGVRQHYVLCTATDPAQVLLDWEVAP